MTNLIDFTTVLNLFFIEIKANDRVPPQRTFAKSFDLHPTWYLHKFCELWPLTEPVLLCSMWRASPGRWSHSELVFNNESRECPINNMDDQLLMHHLYTCWSVRWLVSIDNNTWLEPAGNRIIFGINITNCCRPPGFSCQWQDSFPVSENNNAMRPANSVVMELQSKLCPLSWI